MTFPSSVQWEEAEEFTSCQAPAASQIKAIKGTMGMADLTYVYRDII